MRSICIYLPCLYVVFGLGCESALSATTDEPMGHDEGTVEVIPASEVNWTALNPARGDKSPKAATLWGDRGADEATGFLVQFVDGFSSPPHIHNVTYRGVVISGLVHNDDPDAATMWMPPGSFWTQPAGESHITAAKGDHNVAYIEIDAGPYLVQPPGEAFDNGERPINVHASNLVWLGDHDGPDTPEVAFLWGDPRDDDPAGMLIKLPAGFEGTIQSDGEVFRIVVIEGTLNYRSSEPKATTVMEPGSYFAAIGGTTHRLSGNTVEGCILYARTNGKLSL